MRTPDSPLSAYCGKGRTERLRFLSSVSEFQGHLRETLRRLGVTDALAQQILGDLPSAHFGEGFRFEGSDTNIGRTELDRSEPAHPDASRVVVFVQFYNEALERCIAQTSGELLPFDEVVREAEQTEEANTASALPVAGDRGWRLSA